MYYTFIFIATFLISQLIMFFGVNTILESIFPSGVGEQGESAVFIAESIITVMIAAVVTYIEFKKTKEE